MIKLSSPLRRKGRQKGDPGMKVLVVDDDPVSRLILRRTLERGGFEVLEASDGLEGWELFQRHSEEIRLAVVDWVMPGIDGVELCRRVRSSASEQYVYVVLLSAKQEKRDIVTGLEAGADDYIGKPFEPAELISRMKVGLRIIALEQRLKELATTDPLTKVLNRRAIIERLREELHRAGREDEAVGVILLDIDHFKAVNDRYGHLEGDRVLAETAERLRGGLRKYDALGRYGGEEFLVVIPQPKGRTAEVAERLRCQIAATPYRLNKGPLALTISLGATEVQPPPFQGTDQGTEALLEEVLKRADAALYEAKEGGRNQVVFRGFAP